MKKLKPFLRFSFLILLLEIVGALALILQESRVQSVYPFRNMSIILVGIWFCGMVFLLLKKGRMGKALSRILNICNALLCAVAATSLIFFLLVSGHPYKGSFSLSTPLFSEKHVMIVVPHQDDDINLLGGLIEQYTDAGSRLSVVFTTNGDRYGISETRAKETLSVLTQLGVEKEDIYYLGFGDQWNAQTFGDEEITHIYNSPDPDLVWTSLYGATETYGTETINCYKNLPYTRNNYLLAIESIIEEKQPDTIFAVDFDSHIDHRATTLFFDEALCNVLKRNAGYHPTVYKGFCYGTAWMAIDDYFENVNLLSSKLPDEDTWLKSSFGHSWEDRVRFPMSSSNLNWILTNNSVYTAMDTYASQDAWLQAERILNGDKVFWRRRTDSLLYGASVFVGSQQTSRLTDFKLKDFTLITDITEGNGENDGIVALEGETVSLATAETLTVNSICLYDSPDPDDNILGGIIRFSDGTELEFGPLERDGSPTLLTFPEKQVSLMEITVTSAEGNAGLTEIEAFYGAAAEEAQFLMAVDFEDNFVYDYLLADTTTAFRICSFPTEKQLGEADVNLTFTASAPDASCYWKDGLLFTDCPKGETITVTVSDGAASTTFTVSNPTGAKLAYLTALRHAEQIMLNGKYLYHVTADYVQTILDAYF